MNQQQMLSLVRTVLKVLGTFMVTYGGMNAGLWDTIAGGVVLIVPVVWDMITHTNTSAVAIVAAMHGTDTSRATGTITMVAPDLKAASKAAATSA